MKKITKIEAVKPTLVVRKLRVAAYCRVSTNSDEQLLSLEVQKAHYESLITKDTSCEFAGLYYDEGITGTKIDVRPALKRMIEDCEKGLIDRILTKSLSRFARNTTDCLELVRHLSDMGISLYFEKENIDTGKMESELLLSIMSSIAESESASISENVRWNIKRKFERGTYKLGYAPYGYDVKEGVFSINSEEEPWVRWIFEKAYNGVSTTAIAKELNEKGAPRRRAKKWYSSTVAGILTNEKYTGDCLLQKTYSDFRFKRHINNGEKEQFLVRDHHEALVSREVFEAVGAMIQRRAQGLNMEKGNADCQNRYTFSGLLVCEACGSKLKHRNVYIDSRPCAAWLCSKHLSNKNSCSMTAVREAEIENAFTTMINKLIFARQDIFNPLLEALNVNSNREAFENVAEIESRLERNEELTQTLNTIMGKGLLDRALYIRERNAIEAERQSLLSARNRASILASGVLVHGEETLKLNETLTHLHIGTCFDSSLFEQVVETVSVGKEKIIFNLKCGLMLEERRF